MKTDSKQLLILFAITIIASGCASTTNTGDTSSSSTAPISVNSFEAIPNPVPAGQTVNINMEVENTGESDAEKVGARIFGPTFGTSGNAWKSSDGSGISDTGARTRKFGENSGKLRAPSDSTPSIPKRVSWSLQSPSLDQNREVTYNFYANIFYGYETRASTDFKLVSGERYREQGYSQRDATVENTPGPIQLEVRGTTPKIFYETDNNEDNSEDANTANSEICVRATNQGDGMAFTGGQVWDKKRAYNLQNAEEDRIKLKIDRVGPVEFVPPDSAETEANSNWVYVELVGGNEGFQCFNMNTGGIQTSEQNINTEITAQYNYVEEESTSVTVEGRR